MHLLGKSLTELITLIKKKEVSSSEVFSYFVTRIKKYNPKLNAFIQHPGGVHSWGGSLRGLPLAIKDNVCTEGVRTTASSKVLDNFIPPYDATVVARLKNAGYDVLGKTNMDAWAHGSSTETSDYGLTKNPWNLDHVPGGSSGGNAAAISAYLAPAAIGTDTGGSIRGPASWCGIVGLKPSYGRVSRYGVIAMGSSLDCPGPMALTVEDAAFLLEIVAGHDHYDATSSLESVPKYGDTLQHRKKLIIGVPNEYLENLQDDVRRKIDEAIVVLKKMGHTIKPITLLSPKYVISVYTIIQRAEVSSNLARYDGVRYGNDRSFFGNEAKRRIMLGTYTLSHGYYDAYYKKAQKVRTFIIDDFKKIFKEVDIIIGPTTPMTATKIGEFEKYPFFGEMMDVLNEPASIAGLPAISIPAGLDSNNLPVGLQIIGRYFDEGTILNLAYQFEKETDFFGVIKKGFEKYV